MKKYIFPVLALATFALTSCENDEKEFPDFEGGVSVYFSYQTPIRTILLGSSIDQNLNNSLDNAHKFKIYATQGGVYNTKNISVDIAVDNTLCSNLTFEDGTPVTPMPESYYKLTSTNISSWSNYMGGVEVELTDAFFADPKALTTTYVVPVLIKSQTGADRILDGDYEGKSEGATAPARTNSDAWKELPKDYTLYCVRYVNPWEAFYLVKGSNEDILKCDVIQISTKSLTECNYSILLKDGKKLNKSVDGATAANLTLKFDGDNCEILEGTTKVGTGSYSSKAMEVAPNVPLRDVLKLDYTVSGVKVSEELVMQRRGDFAGTVKTFAPTYNK